MRDTREEPNALSLHVHKCSLASRSAYTQMCTLTVAREYTLHTYTRAFPSDTYAQRCCYIRSKHVHAHVHTPKGAIHSSAG